MPDAYDQDGGVNQEKRFAVALQRYRLVYVGNNRCIDVYTPQLSQ